MSADRRDPNNPAYPHGTPTGANYGKRIGAGCRPEFPCPAKRTCTTIRRAQRRNRTIGTKANAATFYAPSSIASYVRRFLDDGWAIKTIAATAQVKRDTVRDILRSRRAVKAETARAVLAVDTGKLLACDTGPVPIQFVAWMPGSMIANGWTLKELEDRMGRSLSVIHGIVTRQNKTVSRDIYQEFATLWKWSADTEGTSRYAPAARRYAAKFGYQLPEAYADDGTLWDEQEVNDARAQAFADRHRAATNRLEVLRLSLRYRYSALRIVDTVDISPKSVSDYRAEAGIRFERPSEFTLGFGNASQLCEGQEERVAEILAVLDRWEADPLEDPYVYARMLGLMRAKEWNLESAGKPKLRACPKTFKSSMRRAA